MPHLVVPDSLSEFPILRLLDTRLVPDGYLYKDYSNDVMCPLPVVTTQGRTRYLDTNLKIVESTPGKVYLPRIDLHITVRGFTHRNIEKKYQEYQEKMADLRYKYLNRLKFEGGSGVYYYFLFMSQSSDSKTNKNSVVFTEQFSAAWAEKIKST